MNYQLNIKKLQAPEKKKSLEQAILPLLQEVIQEPPALCRSLKIASKFLPQLLRKKSGFIIKGQASSTPCLL